MKATHTTVDCGAVSLRLSQIGAGEPVLFLHGFPELALFWAPLMAALADQFLGLAPDQRGCGASGRGRGADDYQVDALLQDLVGLLDALGLRSCHLVGHDWGGVLAWWFAARYPARVRKLVVFNAPHPAALQARLRDDVRQQAASAYMTVLGQPDAAARLLAAGPRALWDRLRGDAPGFAAEDRDAYVQAWSAPDALQGHAAWYRTSPRDWVLDEPLHIAAPTLIAWGMLDRMFVPELVEDSAAYAPNVQIQRYTSGQHNVPRELTAESAQRLREFLAE